MKYKVTLQVEANTNPRKWLPDTVWEALDSGEDILDYHIEQYEEDDDDDSVPLEEIKDMPSEDDG